MRKVEVTDYNQDWPEMYRKEADILRNIFSDCMVDIQHIGSTSVHGMKAKPVIDILIVLDNIENASSKDSAMIAAGYEPKGEYGIPGRRFYQKGGDERTHHVHAFGAGNPEIERHIVFRDYLRSNREDAAMYGNLKESLARKYPHDIDSYIEKKDQTVKEIERRAWKWKEESAED